MVVVSPNGRWRAEADVDPATDLRVWRVVEEPSLKPSQREGSLLSLSLRERLGEGSVEAVRDSYPTAIAWRADSCGFFYDRYLPFLGGHGLYFHEIGTAQSEDFCVLYTPEHPEWKYQPYTSPDGRWLLVSILNGTVNNRLTLFPLSDCSGEGMFREILFPKHALGGVIPIVEDFRGRYDFVQWRDDELILRAVEPSAPNGKLVAINLTDVSGIGFPETADVISEASSVLQDAVPFGDGWVVHYLCGGSAELRFKNPHHRTSGSRPLPQGEGEEKITLPDFGTVDGLVSDGEWVEFSYTDYGRPWRRYVWRIGEEIEYEDSPIVTRRHWVMSHDRTRVPLFVAHHCETEQISCPTILIAYGGMGEVMSPRFSDCWFEWMQTGGVIALVCARGGGELGAAWHRAGVGVNKQNTFDDVLAAANYLCQQTITTPAQLGLYGVSNGGLTAGACLTQAPNQFGAVVIESGLLDMLDYHNLGRGADWLAEYGSPGISGQRAILAAYSPLHNLQHGTHYPATLITTHEQDRRVGEAHSLRFAAALQEMQGGDALIQLRGDDGSGHGNNSKEAQQRRLTFFTKHLRTDQL